MSLLNLHRRMSTRSSMILLFSGLMVAALALGGCGDDDDDDGAQDFGQATLSLEAISSQTDQMDVLEFVDPDGTDITMTSARFNNDQNELDMPDDVDCDDVEDQLVIGVNCDEDPLQDTEIQIDGPIVVDLVNGQTRPSLGDFPIPALNYEEIDIEVNDLNEDDDDNPLASDDPLNDQTLRAVADFEFDGQKRELVQVWSFDTEAKLGEEDRDFDLQDGDTMVIQFDIAGWLDDIPVTTCLDEADLKTQNGQVVIDDEVSGECSDAEAEFETNFEDSIRAMIERQ